MIKITQEVERLPDNFTGMAEFSSGTKQWYVNGKYHREDGPACEDPNGTKMWYINGDLHRLDGPAIEYANGDKSWYLHGKLHRENGPAIEWTSGTRYWFLNGKILSEDEFNSRQNPDPCAGKVVEIEGKKYKLTPA